MGTMTAVVTPTDPNGLLCRELQVPARGRRPMTTSHRLTQPHRPESNVGADPRHERLAV
jgi:hypothetical protein